jgi:hypothetical protein
VSCSAGTANKILEAKEKERLQESKGKEKEKEPSHKRKKAKRRYVRFYFNLAPYRFDIPVIPRIDLVRNLARLILIQVPTLTVILRAQLAAVHRHPILQSQSQILNPQGREKETANDGSQDVVAAQVLTFPEGESHHSYPSCTTYFIFMNHHFGVYVVHQ